MENTSKNRALAAGVVTGISSFIAWIATIPPEQQTALLAPLVNALPMEWRDAIGLAMRLLASFSVVYAAYSASKSGPATPPKNPTNE